MIQEAELAVPSVQAQFLRIWREAQAAQERQFLCFLLQLFLCFISLEFPCGVEVGWILAGGQSLADTAVAECNQSQYKRLPVTLQHRQIILLAQFVPAFIVLIS